MQYNVLYLRWCSVYSLSDLLPLLTAMKLYPNDIQTLNTTGIMNTDMMRISDLVDQDTK